MPLKQLISNCRKATMLTLKLEEGSISIWHRITLFIHLAFCVYCRRFKKQSAQLNRHAAEMQKNFSLNPPFKMSDDYRKKLEEMMKG